MGAQLKAGEERISNFLKRHSFYPQKVYIAARKIKWTLRKQLEKSLHPSVTGSGDSKR